MHRAIESASDVILHNTRPALKETRLLSIIKLRIAFNGDKILKLLVMKCDNLLSFPILKLYINLTEKRFWLAVECN